ncbi:anoctamin-like protein [Phytophthora infestans T30-4]|uniref:Anoctamin-like protein n=1 Tax=Phytophthora infestans (strain T30-4) TaxID=403677 RepID=D0NSW1_PHYIT|nr:anoctamin-like protein [Phytophthora infestans T30-4]EEY64673.1 anoctamin-like protein [Phytophthora infestans T30-4]|eukprot:XP_002897873.1 anoctamin-like protein [Phytophthora infestans T30-4]
MDLYEASENGNEERVVELLVFGKLSPASQLRARGIAGRTALLAACLGGQSSVVRLLLGKKCIVHFTISMVTKDGSSGVVPMAVVQLPPQWAIPPSDLLEGKQHVDHFGNTPLQCVSCFGCGSSVKHIDDGLDMTRQLLIHGDQPNLPKKSNKWTPLHWAAYNGNHEQIKMLLDPVLHVGDGTRRFAKTQIAIPLLIDTDDLFAVDIAGRRGLALEDERATLQRQLNSEDCDGANGEYAHWRLRLDHIEAVRLFIHEFLANGAHLTRYVAEMNARNPLHFQKNRSRSVTAQDAVRYGQHLLYWAGCFGLVSEVRSLLQLELKMTGVGGSSSPGKAAVKPLVARSMDDSSLDISLRMLYTCSCEYGKRQSVLHAVAAHGQVKILRLFLAKMLDNQLHPSDFSSPVGNSMTSFLRKAARPRKPVVVPISDPTEMTDSSAESGKYTDQLNILEHVNTGWTNYRNETPLFHAVLYLQESAVRFFANVLCSTSLAWELANVNVEGSLLHHICSEISRHTLGIEHQSARPEYVMLFDGVKRKQFKETVIETMHEESSIAPSLVVTRSGVRDTVSGICKAMGEIDYLVIGATDEVLIQQAQRLQLKVKHRGSSTRSMYSASSPELFESFRSLQRQQVILSIIQRKIDLQKHIKNGNIQTIFPLHDVMGCRNIIRQWGYTDSSQRIFQPFAGNSLEQFFLERKRHQYEMLWPLLTYFGEKHAFYYAFVTFYTAWLLPIALVGMACQMLWLANNVSFVPPLFGIVVSIWATLMVERWKRKRSEIQRKFGHFRRNRSEGTPGFYGDFLVETAMIRAKRAVDVSFPRAVQLVRIYTGIPLLLTMAVAAVVIFVAVKTNSASSAVVHNAMPRLPVVLVPYVVPFINAVSMLLLDNWYTRLARSLTTWENHRTVWEFESMLATKLFSFKFLNAFISLFWIAFVDQNATALRKQLLIIMGTRQLWNSIQRDVLPMFHVRLRWKQAGFRFQQPSTRARKYCWSMSSHEWYDAELSHPLTSTSLRGVERPSPPPMILLQELMYPHDFLMGKQMEVVLQFGYVTMFVSVLPVAPLFALLSNVVAMRLDVLSCTQTKRRPPFESETEVSTFTSILEFMSFAAVAVNCAVLFFTTRSDLESLIQLWLLLVVEHVVLGTKALLSLVIDDSASWVRLDEDQTDEEEKKRMLGMNTPENVSTTRRSTEELETMQRRDRVDQSKFNQVLAKQYIAALGERDEALKREQTARRLLAESMKYAEQAHAQTVGRRLCFICFALRNLQIPAGKRCLSCHIALCPTCDGVVHLDDLGVKEPQHFRVKVSKQLRELRRHVESFISYCGLSRGQQRLTCDEAFKRCCASVRIAMRYLRNYEQQRLYLNSSNPTLAPATTEL